MTDWYGKLNTKRQGMLWTTAEHNAGALKNARQNVWSKRNPFLRHALAVSESLLFAGEITACSNVWRINIHLNVSNVWEHIVRSLSSTFPDYPLRCHQHSINNLIRLNRYCRLINTEKWQSCNQNYHLPPRINL